jgi:hypothetical protein
MVELLIAYVSVGEASLFLFKAQKYITEVPLGYKTDLVHVLPDL